MTKKEYQEKLIKLINSLPEESEERTKAIRRWEIAKYIYEHDYSQNRVDWLKKVAEEAIIFVKSGSIPNCNDIEDLAIGVFQLVFWLEEIIKNPEFVAEGKENEKDT